MVWGPYIFAVCGFHNDFRKLGWKMIEGRYSAFGLVEIIFRRSTFTQSFSHALAVQKVQSREFWELSIVLGLYVIEVSFIVFWLLEEMGLK